MAQRLDSHYGLASVSLRSDICLRCFKQACSDHDHSVKKKQGNLKNIKQLFEQSEAGVRL